jgi:hypothetical protein
MRILLAAPLLFAVACAPADTQDNQVAADQNQQAENNGDDFGNWVENAGDDIGNAAEDVANTVENAVEDIGGEGDGNRQ